MAIAIYGITADCRALARFVGTALFLASLSALAQTWPNRPIRMIIPAAPGGGVDTIGRIVGLSLSTALGQPVVVDNRPGAGTMLGSELVAKAPPDGYTLLMMTNSHAINAGIQKSLRYDPVKDFTTICSIATLPYLLIVHPSVPARSAKELIALAKRRPGDLAFSSAGPGSGTHLAFELFVYMAGIKALHVPYRSGSAALTDLAGGRVQMMFSNLINSMPYVSNKRLVALAITTPKPSQLYPELPTVSQSGLPGYESDAWYGLVGPANMPADAVSRLNREVLAIIRTGKARELLATQGADVTGSTPEQFNTILRRDVEKWTKVAAKLNIQME